MRNLIFLNEWINAGRYTIRCSVQSFMGVNQPVFAGSSCGSGDDNPQPSAFGSSCGVGDRLSFLLRVTFIALYLSGYSNVQAQTNKATDEDRYFTTSDGVRLHYRAAGSGTPIVVLPGFGQEAAGFDRFYDGLKDKYAIYCLDYRWVGKSDSPEYGHHIERLATDAKEMMEHEGIDRFHLFGHSMGNSVAWCYFSIYGQSKVIKYILGDEPPCLLVDPSWTDEEMRTYTSNFGNRERNMFNFLNPNPNPSVRQKMLGRLMSEHLARDWRDVIATIKVPVMVV
ncbi:MAG: alpha/beta fold hydrolase, partial [Tannerellaceae bacterium]|nr:alpha/beta fold hydrolase [Tannerellaceae bacterium]